MLIVTLSSQGKIVRRRQCESSRHEKHSGNRLGVAIPSPYHERQLFGKFQSSSHHTKEANLVGSTCFCCRQSYGDDQMHIEGFHPAIETGKGVERGWITANADTEGYAVYRGISRW